MDSPQGNFKMSSFPELDNLIDSVLSQVQDEPLLDQPVSMDEGMDFPLLVASLIGAILGPFQGAIAIGSFGLYQFKDKLLEWYRYVVDFIHEHTQ